MQICFEVIGVRCKIWSNPVDSDDLGVVHKPHNELSCGGLIEGKTLSLHEQYK